MDTRRLITAVLVTILVVFGFQFATNWFAKQMGWDLTRRPPATQPAAPTTGPATATSTAAATTGAAPATQGAVVSAAAQPAVRVAAATQPTSTVVRLGSAQRNDPTYRLAMEVVPRGAAIDRVVLNEFTRAVESKEPYVFQTPLVTKPDESRSLATRAVVVDGTRVELDDVPWTLESSDENGATFSLTLEGDAGPLLRVTKTYEIFDRNAPGGGYEILVRHGLENLSGRPVTAKLVFNGTVTPPREVDRGPDRYFVAGYDADAHADQVYVQPVHHAIEELSAEQPAIDVSKPEGQPLEWAGALSVYFVGIARPVEGAGAHIAKTEAVAFNPEAKPHEREGGIVFETADLQLALGQATALPMRVFLGPRQRGLLKSDYFAKLGFHQILVLTGGPCAWCTFQWLIDLLVVLLRAFHFVFRDWGLAIIGLVVLVRALLHPVTKKSQVSMMKMSKFGPEIERLRKKHGDNKDELNKAMMSFYKEQGFSPVLGCLPMFLQMPIWIALWSALNSTFELRQASFLWGFTWIEDLAKPDHLIEFGRAFDFWFLHISGLNLLPLLMAVVFYLQMKLQPKPVSMTKEQEQQQKIMMWMMPVLFPIMLYSGPSGLNLYILTSTLIGIVESKRIRDHIKQQEAAEAQQRVIVDAPPTRGMKRKRGGGEDEGTGGHGAKRPGAPKSPKTGLAGWLAGLQEKADQVRREAERRGKDKA